jgi:probable DNA metabolism protein
MTELLYDGSFDGFLCAAWRYLSIPGPVRMSELSEQATELFRPAFSIPTDPETARRMQDRFVAAAGVEELKTLLLVHAASDPRRLTLLMDYVRETLRAGTGIGDRMGSPLVVAVQKMRAHVLWEIGKLLGFVRLRRSATGVWYAPISPEANVVGFLGPHFAERFPDQDLLLHDVPRGIAFWCTRGAGGIVDLQGVPTRLHALLSTDREPLVESTWRAYFDAIAIPERRNPRLQEKLMPRRYWKDLIERPQG